MMGGRSRGTPGATCPDTADQAATGSGDNLERRPSPMGEDSPARSRRSRQDEMLEWYERMIGCIDEMWPAELDELHAWEAEHVDGSGTYATSDWPGWASRIGSHPLRDLRLIDRLARALEVPPSLLESIADGEVQGWLATTEGGQLCMRTGVWGRAAPRPGPGPLPASTRSPAQPKARQHLVLYRLLGENDRTLYVGITRNFPARLRAHKRKWGPAIVSTRCEEYDDLEALMEAEAAAIRDERPPLNHDGVDET